MAKELSGFIESNWSKIGLQKKIIGYDEQNKLKVLKYRPNLSLTLTIDYAVIFLRCDYIKSI